MTDKAIPGGSGERRLEALCRACKGSGLDTEGQNAHIAKVCGGCGGRKKVYIEYFPYVADVFLPGITAVVNDVADSAPYVDFLNGLPTAFVKPEVRKIVV